MKNIGTLYRFELRKILSRKLTWVLLAIILAFCVSSVIITSNSNAITFEYTNENGVLTDVSFTNKEYFSKNQEAARKLAGKPMDDTFFAEMRESVPIFGENELAYFLLEDATYQNAYGMLDGLINPQTATAEDIMVPLSRPLSQILS